MEHEQKQISSDLIYDRVPPLSPKYPWFVSQNLEGEDGTEHQVFYTLKNTCQYRCRIPELSGKLIRGCFHGWVILSDHPNNIMWSLWDPLTSKIIHLPPLILEDESIKECCLCSPPSDPNSILLLTITEKPNFVFCWLDHKKERLRWREMSYAKQLKNVTGNGGLIDNITCCNGKVYALSIYGYINHFVVHLDIAVKDREVVIRLLQIGPCPFPSYTHFPSTLYFLKGSGTELLFIMLAYNHDVGTKNILSGVHLFKLDISELKTADRFMWENVRDLKDTILFVNPNRDISVFCSHVIGSELGGYIHILDEMGEVIYSYHVKDNTILLSSMPRVEPTTNYASLWECRLEEGESTMCTIDSNHEEETDNDINQVVVKSINNNISNEFNISFDILGKIMEHCVGVEYMNLRATCKFCHLGAPSIQWSEQTSLKRLHNYSLVSPWLMIVDKNQDNIISFTDPLSGAKYFMRRRLMASTINGRICSRFGWLLIFISPFKRLVFLNPFTNDIRRLPPTGYYLESLCFSAPPTSPDCMVVGFTRECVGYVHFVARDQSWRRLLLDFGGRGPDRCSFQFPTLHDNCIYTLCNERQLYVFNYLNQEDYSWKRVLGEAQTSCCGSSPLYFLVKCDLHLLLVTVGEFGDYVEVFKLNDSAKEWERIDDLGKHTIYICDTTCLSVEAKSREMENKIYFSRLHFGNGKIVFYSLETRMFHTRDGENVEVFGDFLGTTLHLNHHAWIEPTWS